MDAGVPYAVPRVRAVTEVEVIDEKWVRFFFRSLEELPDEFYLRVMKDYDADSTIDEIASLVATYGQLCLDDYAEWDGGWMGNWEQRSMFSEWRHEYAREHNESFLVPDTLLNLWEGRPHLDSLRFLRDGWIVASATGDLADYHRLFEGMEHCGSLQETVANWVNGINKGLGLVHPKIVHPLAEDTGATLYGISCLQLYNHIVEQVQYKICANESCGQIFVRQQGRAGAQQRKNEGVKYCSNKCARAQAQRELRRRRSVQASAEAVLEAQREESRTMTMAALLKGPNRQQVPTLGTLLRNKRIDLQIDDRTVRRRTGVQAPILVAIEADDFFRYEGQSVHMERWLEGLAKLYGIDHKDVVARYRAEAVLDMIK